MIRPGRPRSIMLRRKHLRAVDDAPEIDGEDALPVLERTEHLCCPGWMPALFISTSVPPNRFSTAASSPVTSSMRLTSTAAVMMLAAPPGATDDSFVGGRIEPVGADIGDADLHAEAGEPHRGGKPDAGRASGDDGDIVGRQSGVRHGRFSWR